MDKACIVANQNGDREEIYARNQASITAPMTTMM